MELAGAAEVELLLAHTDLPPGEIPVGNEKVEKAIVGRAAAEKKESGKKVSWMLRCHPGRRHDTYRPALAGNQPYMYHLRPM